MRCDLCDGQALRLMLCGKCWRNVPAELRAAWDAAQRPYVRTGQKLAAALAILEWAKREPREQVSYGQEKR